MTLTMTPTPRRHRAPTTSAVALAQLPLEELVGRAIDGDNRAWREIERRYQQMAQGVARRAGVRPADIPDVLQHVWLQLFRSLPRLRERAFLAAWIRTTTRRESQRLLRRQRTQVLADDLEEVTPVHERRSQRDPVDEVIVRHDVVTEVSRSAPDLAPRCRQLLGVLLMDPSSTYQEISERLGWPMGSIGPTRARCFVSLRRLGHLQPLVEA
jgi:RNA polymerase sigma factor (sigma-70 family)